MSDLTKLETVTLTLHETLDGDIVKLAAGNLVRKVRTPEGAKKYGLPIGSIIVRDPEGHVLKVLHKGDGNPDGGPSVASYKNDPIVAQYNAAVESDKSAKAGSYKTEVKSANKSAFDDKLSKGAHTVKPSESKKSDSSSATDTKTTAAPKAGVTHTKALEGAPATVEHDKFGPMAVHVPDGAEVYKTGTGLMVKHQDGTVIDHKGKSKAVWVHPGDSNKKIPATAQKLSASDLKTDKSESAPKVAKPDVGTPKVDAPKADTVTKADLLDKIKPDLKSSDLVYETPLAYVVRHGAKSKTATMYTTEGKVHNNLPWSPFSVSLNLGQMHLVDTKAEKSKVDAPKVDAPKVDAPEAKKSQTSVAKAVETLKTAPSLVKSTKHGENEYGKIWHVTSHKDGESDLYLVPTAFGVSVSHSPDKVDTVDMDFPNLKTAKSHILSEYGDKAATKVPTPGTKTKPASDVAHVKATKTGNLAHGKPIWKFTSHTSEKDETLLAVPNADGTISVVDDTNTTTYGTFPQMKAAKAWVDKNGVANGSKKSDTSEEKNSSATPDVPEAPADVVDSPDAPSTEADTPETPKADAPEAPADPVLTTPETAEAQHEWEQDLFPQAGVPTHTYTTATGQSLKDIQTGDYYKLTPSGYTTWEVQGVESNGIVVKNTKTGKQRILLSSSAVFQHLIKVEKPKEEPNPQAEKPNKVEIPSPEVADIVSDTSQDGFTPVSPTTGEEVPEKAVEDVPVVAQAVFAPVFNAKDVKTSSDNEGGWVVTSFTHDGGKSLSIVKGDDKKWKVESQGTQLEGGFSTLAKAKQWVAENSEPNEALVKAASTKTTPYGKSFVWNGQQFHLTPGMKAWEENSTLYVSGGQGHNLVTHSPDGVMGVSSDYSAPKAKKSNIIASVPEKKSKDLSVLDTSDVDLSKSKIAKKFDAEYHIGYFESYNVNNMATSALNSLNFEEMSNAEKAQAFKELHAVVSKMAVKSWMTNEHPATLAAYARLHHMYKALDAFDSGDGFTDSAFLGVAKAGYATAGDVGLGWAVKDSIVNDAALFQKHLINEFAKADGFSAPYNTAANGKLDLPTAISIAQVKGVKSAAMFNKQMADTWLQAMYSATPNSQVTTALAQADAHMSLANTALKSKYFKAANDKSVTLDAVLPSVDEYGDLIPADTGSLGSFSLPSVVTEAEKPAHVSDGVWSYVQSVLAEPSLLPKTPSADQVPFLIAEMKSVESDFSKTHPSFLDSDLMAKIEFNTQDYPMSLKSEIAAAVSAQMKTGKFADDSITLAPYEYETKYGNKISLQLRPGDQLFSDGYDTYVYNTLSPETSYRVYYSSYDQTLSYHPISNYTLKNITGGHYGKPVHEVPPKLTGEYVSKKIGMPVSETQFEDIQSSLGKSFGAVAPNGTTKGDALIALKSKFLAADFAEKYPTLSEKGVADLPEGVIGTLSKSLAQGDDSTFHVVELLGKYGLLNTKKKSDDPLAALGIPTSSVFHPVFSKLLDEAPNIGADHVMAAAYDAKNDGPVLKSLKAFGAEIGVSQPDDTASTAAAKIANLLNSAPQASKEPSPQNVELQLTKTSKSLGGMHSKTVWADQHGNEWMSKAFPNDPNSKVRVQAEHAANTIGRLYGFGTPESRLMELDGKLNYVQFLAPSKGDFAETATNWKSMPEKALHDAMSAHVLNWVISDHDGHAGNLMYTADGSGAFSIDHGQAGRFFGKDKLAVGYRATNPIPVWFDTVYDAITNHDMSKEQADKVRDTVLRKAAQVSTRNAKQHRELLEMSIEGRKEFPPGFDAKSWVDAHVERRENAFKDFAKFYEGIYKKAGYEWTPAESDISNYLPKKIADAHVEVSAEFIADVKKSGTHGQALMFGGSSLTDNFLVSYVTEAKDGSDTLRMQGKLQPEMDQVFTDWLKTQTIEKVSASSPKAANLYGVPNNAVEQPLIHETWQSILNYVKTVTTHAGDGQYNQTTVAAADSAVAKLKQEVESAKTKIAENPLEKISVSGSKFVTAEQQATWIANAETLIGYYDKTKVAHAKGVKVKDVYPDETPFQEVSYAPSKGIDTSGDPKVISQVEHNGKTFQKWSDYNYVAVDGDKVTQVTPGDFAEALLLGKKSKISPSKDAKAESQDTETVTAAGAKIVKVRLKTAEGYAGTFTPGSNTVKESGNTVKLGQGNSYDEVTKEYEISFDGVTIRYTPHEGAGANKPQKGLLRIEVPKWDGSEGQISNALQVLRDTGVELDPATEESLEIGYYRKLHNIAKTRKDTDSKIKTLRSAGDAIVRGSSDELDQWRKAFNTYYGKSTMDDFIQSKGFAPTFAASSAHGSVGTPHTFRPDASVENYRKWSGGNLPVHTLSSASDLSVEDVMQSVAMSGLLSTEERVRVLGRWQSGMSSAADQTKGSSGYVFFRQGLSNKGHSGSVFLEPEFAQAASNYAYTGDEYGDAFKKNVAAPFDLKAQAEQGASNKGHGNNEIMIKGGVGIGAIAFMVVSKSVRDALLAKYKEMGIEKIGDVPVSDKFVTSDMVTADFKNKVWERAIAREKARKAAK